MYEEQNIVVENELLRRGFTSIPNYIFGLPISSNAKLIYMALLSYAWTNSSCYPGLSKLCSDVSLSDKPVTRAIEELSNASLLEVKRRGQGKTNLYIIKDFNFSGMAPSGSDSGVGETPNQEPENLRIKNRRISESRIGDSPNQESENLRIPSNEKNTREETQAEKHTHTRAHAERAGGVCVGSKFTLEECRRYAVHLQATAQGINNPGGYATAIFRSGEADEQIESYLRPPAAATSGPDSSQCPDCCGTGFWYPNGPAAGVAKCRHRRISGDSRPEQGTTAPRKLTPAEIDEQRKKIAELLESGCTLEQATRQFSSGFYPEDWLQIKNGATRGGGADTERMRPRAAIRGGDFYERA